MLSHYVYRYVEDIHSYYITTALHVAFNLILIVM
jgi:hypothetical protein